MATVEPHLRFDTALPSELQVPLGAHFLHDSALALADERLRSTIQPDIDSDTAGPTYPPETLQTLAFDVLLPVLELLRPEQNLQALSVTCKWIRHACVPILFESCVVRSGRLQHGLSESFPPPVLWKHVKYVKLSGALDHLCPVIETLDRSLKFSGDFDMSNLGQWEIHEESSLLFETLQSFPLLESISLALRESGVPWNVLEAIVGVPRLRFLSFVGVVACPEFIPPTTFMTTVAPLRKLRYYIDEYRDHPRCYRGEDALFARLATAARDTLGAIHMPSECFPYGVVHSNGLSHLRELHLKGERIVVSIGNSGSHTVSPLISVLARLPSLRILRLHLAQPRKPPEREMIWPHSIAGSMPWPQLETLSVSHPHPDDKLYDHLPASLHRLSLRCWPRHFVMLIRQEAAKIYNLKWTSPILRSSQMLHLLHRCASLCIMELDIEFEEDDEELELFSYVSKGFPNLASLTVHRYRAQGRFETPVEAIAEALAPLSKLVSLRVHLDFKDMPHPFAVFNRHGKEAFANFRMTQKAAATVFAQSIPSLKMIYFLERVVCNINWIPFEVSPTRTVSTSPFGSSHWDNLRFQDEEGPYYVNGLGGRYVVER